MHCNHNYFGNRELVAKFTPLEFQVTLSSNIGGNHELTDSYGFGLDNFYYNSSYRLRVTPDQHFVFSKWSGDSASILMLEDPNSYDTKLTVKADLNLTAIFSERSYQLNVLGSAGSQSLSPESGQFPFSIVDIQQFKRGHQSTPHPNLHTLVPLIQKPICQPTLFVISFCHCPFQSS